MLILWKVPLMSMFLICADSILPASIKERYNIYSAEDFKRGRFWLYRSNDFKAALKKYIYAKENMLVKMFETNADYVFIITEASGESDHCVYRSLDSAIDTIRTNDENTRKIIVKTKLDRSYSYNQIELYLNEEAVPYDMYAKIKLSQIWHK